MRFGLLLCCAFVGLSMAAMTDEELVYGLAKLYTKLNKQAIDSKKNIWIDFTGAMMGWHIKNNRASSAKFRVREGLWNLERAANGTLADYRKTYTFDDIINLEPFYSIYYPDSLSALCLDHMSLTYQQLITIKWPEAKTELERVLLATGIDLTDIPRNGLTGHRLMADGWRYLAESNQITDKLTTELQLLTGTAENLDNKVPNQTVTFYTTQRRVVDLFLRNPKANEFAAALSALYYNHANQGDKDMMRHLMWCLNTRKALGAAVAMSRCISDIPGEEDTNWGEVENTEVNVTAVFHHLAEFSRSFNIHRNAVLTEKVGLGIEEPQVAINWSIDKVHPYDVIRQSFGLLFEEMGVTSCTSSKLDQLVAKAEVESSSTTKYDDVYDDLIDIFQTCWKWQY